MEIYLNRHIRPQLCAACAVNPQALMDLGVELMPDAVAELSIISVEHCHSVVNHCSSLFQLWLQRESNASWKQLLDALKKINLNHLATQIEGMLVLSVDTATHTESGAPVMPLEGNHIVDTATHTESVAPVMPVEGNHIVDTATQTESAASVMPVEVNHFVDTATHTESMAPVMPVEGNHIVDTATHTESVAPVMPVEGNHI